MSARLWPWLLGGCAVTAEVREDDSDTPGSDTVEAQAPRPALVEPAPAVDLDPTPEVLEVTLRAAPARLEVGGLAVDGFAYEGQVPGPTLRARVGDVLVAHLDNALDAPTTIHWHGAGAPVEMDGVPWQRDPTPPGGGFTYRFPLEQPGTFWYHPHFDTEGQVDRGLYGLLVVDGPPQVVADRDVVLVFDAWGEAGRRADEHGLEGTGLVWTVNGLRDPVLDVARGETLRLRLLNASNTGYLALAADGLSVIAGDQGVRGPPAHPDTLVLAPGDRAEALLGVTGDLDLLREPFSLHGGAAWGAPERLLSFRASGEGMPAPAPSGVRVPPSTDPGRTDVVYTFQGDSRTGGWRINGEAFPDVTIAEVDLGDRVVVEVRNLSSTRHPFHLHGHAFEVLSVDGVPPVSSTTEDTLDVGIHQVVRLAFTATRPGDWMVHCHVLPHADGGMMTVLRVRSPP
ncbi:MAG: multicopper oxidase family protein [Alphaproteobacteria bacterium]|nr:multicopper oxidase family protein [Alphaproteobacteria bacterium]